MNINIKLLCIYKMTSLDYAFGNSENYEIDNSNYEPFLTIDESTIDHRKHIIKEKLYSNEDGLDIVYYNYTNSHLDYITNYIYPFWKKGFLEGIENNKKKDDFNPFFNWSNSELAKHNMGLKDNTICFELNESNITIGFCSILLLDKFDREGFNNTFKEDIYDDSIVLYNFIIEKAFRGQGLGKMFLEQIIKYIYNHYKSNYKYITLYVSKENLGAKHIYQSMGFKYLCNDRHRDQNEIYQLDISL